MPEFLIAAWCWIASMVTPLFVQTLIATAFGAISGTLAGTLPVYWVQRRMALRAGMEKHVVFGRAAQYALVRRYEFLVTTDRIFIGGIRETPLDKLNFTRFDHRWEGPRLELERLEFMIPRGGAETYHRLDQKNNQFDILLSEIDQRNEFIKSITGDVQADRTKSGVVTRELFEEVQHRNRELIQTYDNAMEGMVELMAELRATFLNIYPKASFLRWDMVQQETESSS